MTTTLIHDGDSGLPVLPQTPLAREVVELVTRTETPSIANHSIRSYLYARLVGSHRGLVAERDYEKLTGKRLGFKEFLMGEGPNLERLDLTRDHAPMRDVEL